MNALLALALMLGCLWAFKTLMEWVCPPAGKLVNAMSRTVVNIVWRFPARQFGVGPTILGFLLFFAVVLSLAALTSRTGRGLAGTLFLWSLLYLFWRFLRWRADRQFQPRPLPHHERRRER